MTVLRHAAHGCCYSVAALQSVAIAVIASTSATSASNRIRSMWSHSGDRDRQIVVDRVFTKGALGNARADCRVRVLYRVGWSVRTVQRELLVGWFRRLGNGGMGSRIIVCFVFFFLCALLVSTFFFFGWLSRMRWAHEIEAGIPSARLASRFLWDATVALQTRMLRRIASLRLMAVRVILPIRTAIITVCCPRFGRGGVRMLTTYALYTLLR